VAELKPIANERIEALTELQMAASQLKNAASNRELRHAAEALRRIKPPLAARAEELLKAQSSRLLAAEKIGALLPPLGFTSSSTARVERASRSRKQPSKIPLRSQRPKLRTRSTRSGCSAERQRGLPTGRRHSGKALDVPGNSTEEGFRMQQYPVNGSPAQEWEIEPVDGGYFHVIARASGKLLTARSGVIQQWSGDGSEAQQWQLAPVVSRLGGWQAGDIGPVIDPGEFTQAGADGSFTVTAAGADIWGNEDAFHFAHQKVSGDFEFIARIASLQNSNPWAKAGLMARASLAADAANLFIAFTPGNGATFQQRPADGAATTHQVLPDWQRPMAKTRSQIRALVGICLG
jgi:hypothetical protein